MKKILIFLLCLIPWFFSGLFMGNMDFYDNLYLPIFAPPGITFGIVWPILYLLIAISIFMIISNNKYKDNKSYYWSLIINYIFNQSFTILFFKLESPFLGMISTIGTFVSSLFLYSTTKDINKKASYLLIPYIIWGIFASILSISIYFMNV